MPESGIYGEHTALWGECGATEYTLGTSFVVVKLNHVPTGMTASATGRAVSATRREALVKLANRLAALTS